MSIRATRTHKGEARLPAVVWMVERIVEELQEIRVRREIMVMKIERWRGQLHVTGE